MAAPLDARKPSISVIDMRRRRYDEKRMDHLASVVGSWRIRSRHPIDAAIIANFHGDMKSALNKRYWRNKDAIS